MTNRLILISLSLILFTSKPKDSEAAHARSLTNNFTTLLLNKFFRVKFKSLHRKTAHSPLFLDHNWSPLRSHLGLKLFRLSIAFVFFDSWCGIVIVRLAVVWYRLFFAVFFSHCHCLFADVLTDQCFRLYWLLIVEWELIVFNYGCGSSNFCFR